MPETYNAYFQKTAFWLRFSLLVSGAFLAYQAILNPGYFYLDDAFRVTSHTSINQGIQGRPFADAIYWLFSQGLFIDISPFSQIFCLACYAFSALLICAAFGPPDIFEHRYPWFATFAFFVFPAHAACLAYRYDSICFGVSLLLAVGAFYFSLYKTPWSRFGSCCLLFLSLCTYQTAFNAYISIALFGAGWALLAGQPWRKTIQSLLWRFFMGLLAIVLYLPVTINDKLSAAQPFAEKPDHKVAATRFTTIIGDDLAHDFFVNLEASLNFFISGFNTNFLCFFLGMIIVLTQAGIFCRRYEPEVIAVRRKLACVMLFIAAFLASFGVLLFLKSPPKEWRALCPVILFFFCLLLFAHVRFYSGRHKPKKCARVAGCILMGVYLCLSMATLSMIGNGLRDQGQFEREAILAPLVSDLSHLAEEGPLVLYGCIAGGDAPNCKNYQDLRNIYGFLNPVVSYFWTLRLVSLLPVRIAITANDTPPEKCPIVARGLYYELRHIAGRQYYFCIRHDAAPRDIPRYQTKYGFFLWDHIRRCFGL